MKILKNLLFLLLFASTSFAGTIHPNIDDEEYVEYGKDFDCISRVCGVYENGETFCGSSVIIKPRWIITAAHVVDKASCCGIIRSDGENDFAVLVEKTFIHKDYKHELGKCDIAVCYLKKEVELKFYPELYKDNDEAGKICSISGYGMTGTFLTGSIKFDGKRRAGSNFVDCIIHDLLMCSPTKISTKNNKLTSLEFMIASGDSGGGLFIDKKIAGINSCVMCVDGNPNSTYGDSSGHTRISKFAKWIEKTIEENK